ncbi:c-type cytochrome [Segnochrobactrum spirostomi]|uniref:c-type cytochrome n=1 Tax=Segnochrobactrum spirostomi TaxID=2608987 RepID=UPI001FE8C2F6|nr:cytochrome c [Segnochrobactrum spirostomi]
MASPPPTSRAPVARAPSRRPSVLGWLALAVSGVVVLALGGFYVLTMPWTLSAADLPKHTADLANGERMFWAGGCVSCHAAPGSKGDDRLKLVGGVEIASPFGTFVTPNISSDRTAGIGAWSDLDFVNAMMRGVSPAGEHLYPAFPYTSYQHMRIEDLLDLRAYLATLPADATPSKSFELPFPFNIRRGIGLWKLVYLDGKPYAPDLAWSASAKAGGYLVVGPGHCGECHTPRDAFGGLEKSRWLAGGPAPDGKGRIPDITPTGAFAKWSASDIAEALDTGFTPDFDTLGGSMAEVVENLHHLADQDRADIAAYLKAIPPVPPAAP